MIGARMKELQGLNLLVAAFHLYNTDPDINILDDEIDNLIFKMYSGYYNGQTDKYAMFLTETRYNKGYWYFEFGLHKPGHRCIYLGRDYATGVDLRMRIMHSEIRPEYWLF